MLKKIIAGIAGLTFAFSVVVSSGTLQTKAMETTTETTAEETTDTDGNGLYIQSEKSQYHYHIHHNNRPKHDNR